VTTMPNHRRSEVAAWIPAVFCFVVSYIPLVLNPTGIASPAFLAFLPMCFVFVGSHVVALQRRIAALEAAANAKAAPGPGEPRP